MQALEDNFANRPQWLIEYAHRREYRSLPPGFSPNMTQTTVTNMRKGEWRYLYHEIERDKNKPSRTWCVWKDGVSVHRVAGSLQILPDFHPVLLERFFYTNTLFLNLHPEHSFSTKAVARAFGDQSPKKAFPNGLPGSIEKQQNAYIVRLNKEIVGNDPCFVIEKKSRDVIWLDPAHGFVCRKRIEYFDSGAIAVEYHNDNLKQFAEGLWLPQHQEVFRYNGSDTPSEFRGKIRYVERNDLTRLQFGNVDADWFEVPVPQIGVVSDHIRGIIYECHPQNAEASVVFADAAARARTLTGSPPASNDRGLLLIGVNVLIILAIILVMQIRKKSFRSRRDLVRKKAGL